MSIQDRDGRRMRRQPRKTRAKYVPKVYAGHNPPQPQGLNRADLQLQKDLLHFAKEHREELGHYGETHGFLDDLSSRSNATYKHLWSSKKPRKGSAITWRQFDLLVQLCLKAGLNLDELKT